MAALDRATHQQREDRILSRPELTEPNHIAKLTNSASDRKTLHFLPSLTQQHPLTSVFLMKRLLLCSLALGPVLADPTPPHAINFKKLRQQKLQPVDSSVALELLAKALADTSDPTKQIAILKGMKAGLEGQQAVTPPLAWEAAKSTLSESSVTEVKNLTQSINQVFGDQDATATALFHLNNDWSTLQLRRSSLNALVAQNHPELPARLPKLLAFEALQIDAIRAYATVHDPKAPDHLLKQYSDFPSEAQQAVIQTLSTRKDYATALLTALKKGSVPKDHIPAYLARSLTALLGQSFTEFYGDLKQLSLDKEGLFKKYRTLLTPEKLAKANPAHGRKVYQTSCAACHILYDEGGKIGPDLTGSNRADIDYILLNMIDPSADIPEAYQLVTLVTKSGQNLVGTITAEDDQRVTLNSVGQSHTILKSNLKSRQSSPVSMMPEGLLPSLSDQQVLDLVKYLRSNQQVPLSK